MAKRISFTLLAALLFLLPVSMKAFEPALALQVDFEDIELVERGTTFVSGVTGKGLFFDGRSEGLNFSLPERILYNNGTLMFWVKPNWHLYDGVCHRLLYLYDDMGKGKKTLLTIDKGERGAENLFVVTWDGGKISVDSSWLKELSWNHIALTWNKTSGKIALYINGQLAAIKKGSVGKYLLGELGLELAYSSDFPAIASFDELYLAMRELSNDEILAYAKYPVTSLTI